MKLFAYYKIWEFNYAVKNAEQKETFASTFNELPKIAPHYLMLVPGRKKLIFYKLNVEGISLEPAIQK